MKFRLAAVAAITLMMAATVSAHHSFAMFDQQKSVTLAGIVAEFQWTNPHAFIEIDVPNAAGKPERWSVELNSPNNLKRQGWSRTTLKPGDKAKVVIAPLRDGTNGGLFVAVELPDGKVLGDPTRMGTIPFATRP